MTATIIFPHQLFKDHAIAEACDKYYLTEDPLFFRQYRFHKAKLVLHRASMKYYEQWLTRQGHDVTYIEYHRAKTEQLFDKLQADGIQAVKLIDPTDYLLERRLTRAARAHNISLGFTENPNFLTTKDQLKDRLTKNKNGYLMAGFYKTQRKALEVLTDDGEPVGGKWSFDEDNRKKLPKNIKLPDVKAFGDNEWVEEAINYVMSHFEDNPGACTGFAYPVTHEEASEAFDDFLENRMDRFGDYEDAIAAGERYLFHSLLTPALNTGLLSPREVLTRLFEKYEQYHYPLNSLEGFVRQVIGWREFMRGIYEFEGVFERTNNHFDHHRPIPASFYDGTTGIVPIDSTIRKVLKTGYCHHIERLMLLGNFMLLCEFDPDAIYQWFMELFIDAYDWVMVPNVYGMTQYADGGLITTKPYISGSNYVLKMSNYKKGEWCAVWDALYWRFIHKHREEFRQNQRMSFMTGMLGRMKEETLKNHLKTADAFLKNL